MAVGGGSLERHAAMCPSPAPRTGHIRPPPLGWVDKGIPEANQGVSGFGPVGPTCWLPRVRGRRAPVPAGRSHSRPRAWGQSTRSACNRRGRGYRGGRRAQRADDDCAKDVARGPGRHRRAGTWPVDHSDKARGTTLPGEIAVLGGRRHRSWRQGAPFPALHQSLAGSVAPAGSASWP